MPTIPVQDYGHRSHELPLSGFAASPSTVPKGLVFDMAEWPQPSRLPLLVTKLLERSEWGDEGRKAVKAEGRALIDSGTWLESTVIEKKELVAKAKASGNKIH